MGNASADNIFLKIQAELRTLVGCDTVAILKELICSRNSRNYERFIIQQLRTHEKEGHFLESEHKSI